jgi:hypothetical protein
MPSDTTPRNRTFTLASRRYNDPEKVGEFIAFTVTSAVHPDTSTLEVDLPAHSKSPTMLCNEDVDD